MKQLEDWEMCSDIGLYWGFNSENEKPFTKVRNRWEPPKRLSESSS